MKINELGIQLNLRKEYETNLQKAETRNLRIKEQINENKAKSVELRNKS